MPRLPLSICMMAAFSCQTPDKNLDGLIDENVITESYPDHCNYIYLLEHSYTSTHESIMWQFNAGTGTMELIGELDCPFDNPNDYLIAMTADQNGVLWFVSTTEYLYYLDPETFTCYSTGIAAHDQAQGMHSRSLAFMRADSNAEDVLYLGSYTGWNTPEQAVLSKLENEDVRIVSPIEGLTGTESAVLELAGTANGKLYGQSLGYEDNSRFFRIEPSTGAVLEEWDLGIGTGSGFTFAVWKNEVWFFPSTGENGAAEVYRFDPDRNEMEYNMTLPHTMVGAAAPTCSDMGTGS